MMPANELYEAMGFDEKQRGYYWKKVFSNDGPSP
jgi:hypothetical protein